MPPRVVRRNDEEAEIVKQRLAHRWGAHPRTDKVPRSVIRVPFSQGSIAVGHMDRWTYTGRDVELAAAFAEALFWASLAISTSSDWNGRTVSSKLSGRLGQYKARFRR